MQNNIIFIWIPKTAGTSIFDILKKENDAVFLRDDFSLFQHQRIATFAHINVLELLSNGIITQEYFDNSFKFSFVRNPWDRLVSLFFHAKALLATHKPFPELMEVSAALENFNTFCHFFCNRPLKPVSISNEIGKFQPTPQADWVTDKNGKIFVNFIGKVERIDEDFQKVCEIINIPRRHLPKSNGTTHLHYSSYYTPETQRLVAKAFEKDIDMFGYVFKKCDRYHAFTGQISILKKTLKNNLKHFLKIKRSGK